MQQLSPAIIQTFFHHLLIQRIVYLRIDLLKPDQGCLGELRHVVGDRGSRESGMFYKLAGVGRLVT